MRRLAAVFLAILCTVPVHAAQPDLEQVERQIVRGTNEFRAENGLGRLEVDANLGRASRAFADYMARTDRYAHDADGTKPADRAQARGYEYCSVLENISYQFSTASFATEELARRFVEGWKGSPGHRRNLLDPHVLHMSASVAQSARTKRFYGVQMFGRPRASSFEFGIANHARAQLRYRVGDEPFTLSPGQERIHTVCAPRLVTFTNAQGGPFTPGAGDRLRVEGDRRLVVREKR